MGCGDIFGGLDPDNGTGTLTLVAMHHGTPVDGEFPDLATHPDWREFENDEGHRVKFADGFRTFTGVRVIGCNGESFPTDFQFKGPRAESFCDTDDFESTMLGWAELPAGQYCTLEIDYGPYEFPSNDDDSDVPVPDVPDMDGMTAMVRVTEGESNRFEWADNFDMTVRRTIRTIEDGGALNIEAGDNSSNRIAITIAYDRLLDGVDLSQDDPDVSDAVMDGLRNYTGVMWGSSLRDPDAISYDED